MRTATREPISLHRRSLFAPIRAAIEPCRQIPFLLCRDTCGLACTNQAAARWRFSIVHRVAVVASAIHRDQQRLLDLAVEMEVLCQPWRLRGSAEEAAIQR